MMMMPHFLSQIGLKYHRLTKLSKTRQYVTILQKNHITKDKQQFNRTKPQLQITQKQQLKTTIYLY